MGRSGESYPGRPCTRRRRCVVTIDSRLLRQTIETRHYEDFGLFYAQALRATRGENPYGPFIRPGREKPDNGKNLNPPHFHLLMRPFTWFKPSTAFALWVAGWTAAVTALLVMTFNALSLNPAPWALAMTLLGVLASSPTITVLFTGQFSPMLALGLTWAWIQARSDRWDRAAVALGLLASLKLFIGLFLIYLLAIRKWRAAIAFTAAVSIPFVAGLGVFGFEGARSYLATLGSVTWAGNVMNGSVYGFLERISKGTWGVWTLSRVASAEQLPVLHLWLIISVPIVVVSVWTTRVQARPRDVDRAFLLLTTGALLASPLGWAYYYWLFAGPFIAIVACPGWGQLSGPARALICIAVPGLLCPPSMLQTGQPSGVATLTIGSLYFWSLGAIWVTALLSRRPVPVSSR